MFYSCHPECVLVMRYTSKFQRLVFVESSWVWPHPATWAAILMAVLWSGLALLTGSGCGIHRHAQLVDILAQRREVYHFSCCRTAASEGVVLQLCSVKLRLSFMVGDVFFFCFFFSLANCSKMNIAEVDMSLSWVNPLCRLYFLPLRRTLWSYWPSM